MRRLLRPRLTSRLLLPHAPAASIHHSTAAVSALAGTASTTLITHVSSDFLSSHHTSPSALSPFRWDATATCASSPTLPAAFYHAPVAAEWERRSVFRTNWLYVGHTDQLPAPNTFVTGSFLNIPYVLVRTASGRIAAYYNCCCHHAMPLATQPAGELPHNAAGEAELVCGYHGWRYGAEDGRLRRATRLKGIEEFKASRIALASIALEVVGPFIFAHLSPGSSNITSAVASAPPPPPSTAHLQQLHSILSPTGYTSLVHCARRAYTIKCNHKVYSDNYLDGGYHVSHAHPALASALDLANYSTTVLSSHLSLQSSPPASTSARVSTAPSYLHLFPHVMFNRYGRWMDVNVVRPLSAVECEVVMDWWCEPGMSERERSEGVAESEAVQAEDVVLCEGVQRGLESGVYVSGRYAPAVEHAMHNFHCTYYREVMSVADPTSGNAST